jgi:hypothetical protein
MCPSSAATPKTHQRVRGTVNGQTSSSDLIMANIGCTMYGGCCKPTTVDADRCKALLESCLLVLPTSDGDRSKSLSAPADQGLVQPRRKPHFYSQDTPAASPALVNAHLAICLSLQPPRNHRTPPLALAGPHLLPDSRNGCKRRGGSEEPEQRAGGSSEQALSFYMWPMAPCPVAGRAPSDLSAYDGWGRLIFRHTLVATVYLSFPFPLCLPRFLQPYSLVDAHCACARAVKKKE